MPIITNKSGSGGLIKKPTILGPSPLAKPALPALASSQVAEEPSPSASPVQVIEPTPTPTPTPNPDFDLVAALDDLADCQSTYGLDLTAALQNLTTLTHREGVTLAQIRDGFREANAILLQKPDLCTEIMQPAHLGLLCEAARRLTSVSYEVGEARSTKSKTNQAAKATETSARAALLAQVELTDDSEV